MSFITLALSRAGAADLQEFQRQQGLYPSGQEDILTMQRLMPYLLGYERYMVKPGDSFFQLARRFSTTIRAIRTANPGLDPRQLTVGQYLIIPYGFPVVPTNEPFTYELLDLCIQGLLMRYPFLSRQRIGTTAYGRSLWALQLVEGRSTALYNAVHHAHEWITVPVLMKFLEEYAAAVSRGGTIYQLDAADLFRKTRLCMVPMVNPDGVDLVTGAIAEGSLEYEQAQGIAARFPGIPFPDGWKANLLGTDLNLNYPAGWEQARENKYTLGYDQPAPRDFVGVSPLDQNESRAMARLTRELSPKLTLSYHSQGEVIYWKFLDLEPEGAEALGQQFAQASGYLLEDTPFASGFAGYKDWFIQEFDRPGYTIEVGQGANPLPLDQFDQIYRDNLGILTLGLSFTAQQ